MAIGRLGVTSGVVNFVPCPMIADQGRSKSAHADIWENRPQLDNDCSTSERVIQASAIPRECSVRTSSCLQVSSCNGWPTGDVSSATSITSRNLCASSRSNNAGLVSPARPPWPMPPEFAGIRRNRHSHVGRPDGVAGDILSTGGPALHDQDRRRIEIRIRRTNAEVAVSVLCRAGRGGGESVDGDTIAIDAVHHRLHGYWAANYNRLKCQIECRPCRLAAATFRHQELDLQAAVRSRSGPCPARARLQAPRYKSRGLKPAVSRR